MDLAKRLGSYRRLVGSSSRRVSRPGALLQGQVRVPRLHLSLHTRLEEICIETDEYTHVAIKTRPPHRIPAVYEDLIGEALRHYGLEADSYSLLLDLERAYSEALVWIAAQMRCDLFLMDAFLTDEHADYRLDALFLLPPRRKKLKPSEVGEKRGEKQ